MQPLFVFAEITPEPDHYASARQAILDIQPDTRAEAGCVQFDLMENAAGNKLYLYEQWRDEAALEAHHAKSYTVSVFDSYKSWLAEPPRILHMHIVE